MTTSNIGRMAGEAPPKAWRDRKRYLWLMGLIPPDRTVPRCRARVGLQPTGLVGGSTGVVVDRRPTAVRNAPPPRQVLRARRPEPSRGSDGTARERQVLPVLHVRVHPVPADEPRLRVLPLVGGQSLLARHRRRPRTGVEDRRRVHRRRHGRHRHQHRARDGSQEDRTRTVAGQDHSRADLLRPLLHRAQPGPPRPSRHTGGPGEFTIRRKLLDVPAPQCLGEA